MDIAVIVTIGRSPYSCKYLLQANQQHVDYLTRDNDLSLVVRQSLTMTMVLKYFPFSRTLANRLLGHFSMALCTTVYLYMRLMLTYAHQLKVKRIRVFYRQKACPRFRIRLDTERNEKSDTHTH